jgi:hypothetical protein
MHAGRHGRNGGAKRQKCDTQCTRRDKTVAYTINGFLFSSTDPDYSRLTAAAIYGSNPLFPPAIRYIYSFAA